MIVSPEGLARHHCHMFFRQELFSELQRVRDAIVERCTNVRVRVKRPLRLLGLDPRNLAQPLDDVVAAFAIFGQHRGYRVLGPTQGFDRGFL